MGKQFGKEILVKVLELEEQGYTHRMVAEELGYTKMQIKELVRRQRKKEQKPIVPAKRGRPRKHPIGNQEEYEKRIQQLEMENELLRSFLQAAGRK